MMDLMLTGKLPESIMDFADEAQQQAKGMVDLKQIAKSGKDFILMLDTVVLSCVLEPPVAEKGDDDHLGLDEISGDDKMEIFNWVNREVDQLRPFREGEVEPVASLQPSDGLRATP